METEEGEAWSKGTVWVVMEASRKASLNGPAMHDIIVSSRPNFFIHQRESRLHRSSYLLPWEFILICSDPSAI